MIHLLVVVLRTTMTTPPSSVRLALRSRQEVAPSGMAPRPRQVGMTEYVAFGPSACFTSRTCGSAGRAPGPANREAS